MCKYILSVQNHLITFPIIANKETHFLQTVLYFPHCGSHDFFIIMLAFTLKICKLCHTELKDNFKEDTAMLQISEIVMKTEEMSNLFNEHFYNKELTLPTIVSA